MYYVWKNDADNSLKIAVKYYKPNDFDPSNPSFMDITNQSNFIQGVHFLITKTIVISLKVIFFQLI